jgi:S1-C subfamily serine protease
MKSTTRRAKKPASSGVPVVWLVCAVLCLLLFVGGVVGGLMWMVQKATVLDDPPPPPAPPPIQAAAGPGPGAPAFEGKEGEPHEVPKGPFPPAGFPANRSILSEHALHTVRSPIPSAAGPDEKNPPASKPAKIGPEARAAVKSGTVYIRVMRPGGGGGSGSGFFAAADAPNLVVTNAHVVGMLEPASPEPAKIEVFVHSGQKNERKYAGKVLGVDRSSDLAIIDIGIDIGVKEGLPKPLTVGPAASVQELDEVYVFGFPFGEKLGKEITIRDTTVSSLRKRDGVLDRIQTRGGMDPGNSGGPVVDTNGHLVGVSVAGIAGKEIQFAIPSDRVQGILNGRVRGFGIGQPIKRGDKIMAPVRIETIDPSGQIKEAGAEVWTGNPPATAERTRPASSSPPAAKPGDSPRKRTVLANDHPREGDKFQSTRAFRGEIELPPLSAGKVYWVQPTWVHRSGETVWGSASVYAGGQPLLPKPVELHTRLQASETGKRVLLATGNRIYSDDEDTDRKFRTTSTVVGFDERVTNSSPVGAILRLNYQGIARLTPGKKEAKEDATLQALRAKLNVMKARVELETNGSLIRSQFAPGHAAAGDETLRRFHESLKPSLDLTYLPLPGRTVKPGDSWEVKRIVTLMQAPLTGRNAQLDLTCTYLGARTGQAGREEAVVGLWGDANTGGSPGRVYGEMIVDVATCIIRSVDLNMAMNLSGTLVIKSGPSRSLRLYMWMAIQLQREL